MSVMSTPIAQAVVAFDKSNIQSFTFVSSGGNQVVKNRLTIRDNLSNAIVYQHTVESFLFKQDLPANTLTNGMYYNFYFNTYDIYNNESDNSNSVAFRCYTTPTITLTNAPSNNRIEATSWNFDCTYNQVQGEMLDYLVYYLYDFNGVEISNSGRLYSAETPPIQFTYPFSGFEESVVYKMQVKAVSVNGTQSSSVLYQFTSTYYQPYSPSLINLTNQPDDGYVNIQSNVVLAEGVVSPAPALFRSTITDGQEASYIQWDVWFTETSTNVVSQWAERYQLQMTDLAKTLTFGEGFSIPSNFQYQIWLKPNKDGIVGKLYNSTIATNELVVTMKSGIPSGESTVKNWFELSSSNGSVFKYSNYVNAMNMDSIFTIWFEKEDTTYNLFLDVISVGSGTAISWDGTATYPTTSTSADIDSIFPLDTVTLRNGVYDNLDISSDTTKPYSRTYPEWNYSTKLNCDFSTLSAGNLEVALSQLESIRIKRRISSGFDWITLYQIPISNVYDLNIVKTDALVPTNETFEYAIVPVMSGGAEGDYIISSITTCFNWCYLCDNDTIIKFYSNTGYPTITSNPSGAVYAPIGRAKPITVYNSNNNYESGSFGGDVLGSNFLDTRRLDRKDIQDTLKTYKSFINNKKPKILKDWDGRIRIVDTNIDTGLSENTDLISGKSNLTMTWVEKGAYDNQQDLYDNGLVDIL